MQIFNRERREMPKGTKFQPQMDTDFCRKKSSKSQEGNIQHSTFSQLNVPARWLVSSLATPGEFVSPGFYPCESVVEVLANFMPCGGKPLSSSA
jgi:hypothetical protein